ncbi:MAG TPA: nickel pincer cofactor biosynthesis protein LarB [Chthonomonadaceae bacterium]|nr:nickel pincer cofactor biosynthesis protein LarB [Chthonomonadaceae bacterium]
MEVERLREILESVQAGAMPVDEALSALRSLPFEDLGFAKLDHHRPLRNGFPEVVYCPGKATEHILAIVERLAARSRKVLASRATPEVAAAVQQAFPQAVYHEMARMLVIPGTEASSPESVVRGTVLVVSAGTADLPVAEEAVITASEMGSPVERLYDVGVAGIHRLLAHQEQLFAANVVIVVAGMEGALASVVGGLVSRPVIAVPTSVGYGASFQGLSALLTMLNSCASGVGVVNIDNGFGAGYLAHLINTE